jgi:hypothetical protein
MLTSQTAYIGMPDEADTLPVGNEIKTLWDGVVAAYREGGSLAQQRDEGVWCALEAVARLYDAVAARSNDPENAWSRFLQSKGIRRTRRRHDGKYSLFYGLIEHLSNEHASQDETLSKSIISRRAAVLQRWHDQERMKVAADQVAGWIATNGGVKAIAAIANPPMTKTERKAARDDRKMWCHRLVDSDSLVSINCNALPDHLRRVADGTQRLALIRVRATDANAGAVDIDMVEDGPVSQRWLNQNAQGIVERRLSEAYRSAPSSSVVQVSCSEESFEP